MVIMDIDYKIKNLREALDNNLVKPDNYYNFFNAILDMFQDVNKEIDEINEMIQFSKY
jgi:hypothetical protein